MNKICPRCRSYFCAVGVCPVCIRSIDPGFKMMRVQRKGTKGWRLPPNTVYVGRPSPFGNPYGADMGPLAVDEFERFLGGYGFVAQAQRERRERLFLHLPLLFNKNVACWCKLDAPCHADKLIELVERLLPPEGEQ